MPSAIPSPRCPRRATTRCSTTMGLDKEFLVAVAAADWRRDRVAHPPLQGGDEPRNVAADRSVNGSVAHDALFDVAAIGLELRLDERNKRGGRFQQPTNTGQHELE